MDFKKRVAVIGYGNVGRFAVAALKSAPDLELAGIVENQKPELRNELTNLAVPWVNNIKDLPDVQAAILCLPSRMVPTAASEILALGINTVDCFDIHSEIADYHKELDLAARRNNAVGIISAGWDPGTDSMIRCIFEFMAPAGITYTNFGPGMSMGHSVAARAIHGVKEALAMTIPQGAGVHKRMVYIELEPGQALEDVTVRLKADDYFAHDDTTVVAVDDIKTLIDMGHGVLMQRKGSSSSAHNQLLSMQMNINNPALTAQIMVASARAVFKQQPGAYTMIEIPIIDYLPGDKEAIIRKYV